MSIDSLEQLTAPLCEPSAALRERLANLIAAARAKGVDLAEASISEGAGYTVSARLGDLETTEFHQDISCAITVYSDHCKGSAKSTDLRPAALAEALDAACEIARHAQPDPCHGLADAELMATEFQDLDLAHPWPIGMNQATEAVLACEDAGRSYDPRIVNSEGASLSSYGGRAVYANTHGFLGESAGTAHSLGCALLAEDEAGMRRDYWFTSARRADDLDSGREVGVAAAERSLARLAGRTPPTGACPVLFESEVAAGLLGSLVAALSGGLLYRHESFLEGSLGERLLPEWLSLVERPHLKTGAGSANFDGEGVQTREKEIVRGGTVASYLLSSYSARRLDMQTTGNAGGVHNLILEAESVQSRRQLLESMGRGLVVRELMGQGVNLVNGDYSRGVAGFWVENGEIAYPVQEVTIAGNLGDMFAGILAVGDDADSRRRTQTGSLLIESMMLATPDVG